MKLIAAQSSKNHFNFKVVDNLSEILVDTDKFQQIILNIIENAHKYSNENTGIDVEVTQDDKAVIIRVSDVGAVIDEKDRDRIFEKFTRLSTPLTQKTQGSGLGLFLTKTLVERMNGTICTYAKGEKTVFEVKFPIAQIGDDVKAKMK